MAIFNATVEQGVIKVVTVGTQGPQGPQGVQGPAGGATNIQEEGTALPLRGTLNFIGAGITATDDPGNVRTNVTIDSDLNAIAALATTPYGRGLLTLANATALAAEVDSFFLTQAEGNAAYSLLGHTHLLADITNVTASAAEVNFLVGVTSSVQTQLNGKAATIHTHVSTDIADFNEAAQDAVGAALLDTATVDLVYNDGANTISANVLTDTSTQRVRVVKNSGAVVGTRPELNFIEGANITLTVADDSGNNQVDITVAASGSVGEANTASNVNVGGVGVFKQKTGVNLEFRAVNAGSNKVSVVLDTGNNEIDVDVVEANLTVAQSQVTSLVSDLAGKQPLDATLTSLAAFNTNGVLVQTAADTFTGRTITGTTNRLSVSNGNGVSGNPTVDIDAGYVGQGSITTLGTITSGVWTGTTIAVANGGTGATTASGARTNLGLIIGTDVQAFDADLTAIAAFGSTGIAVRSAADTWVQRSVVAGTGISVTNGDGVLGNMSVAIDSTVATLTGTQTFTNKSLVDASTSIIDDVDATKIAKFQSATIATGTTRTFTFPNADGTFSLVGHTHVSTDIADFNEAAQDAVGTILVDSSTIDFTYNDGANTITAAVLADTVIEKVEVTKNSGAVVGTRKQLNFIEGTAIVLTIADDSVNNQVDITINATGTGDYDTIQEEGTSLTQRTTMNFIGSGITAVDNAGATRTDISLDNTLNSLSQFNTNGLLTQTAADTFVGRTLTGTTNRITLTNGDGVSGNPNVDISSSYVGQSTITTLGTITTGVWTGTTIAVANGGTGATTASGARTNLGLIIGTDVQAFDATLLSIAALGTAADKIAYTTGVDTWAETPLTVFGRSLIDDAAASNARTTLGVVIGTDVQAFDADLTAVAALGSTGIAVRSAADTWVQRSIVAGTNITVTNGDGVSGNPSIALTGTIVNSVNLTQPAAGLTLTNSGVTQTGAAVSTFALANDLSALEGLGSTGIAVRSATDTWVQRSIAGTSARITLTNGDGVSGNPTVDIASTYVGQSSITTLGTITTGTWTGTTIAIANGGTGQTTQTAAFNALDPLTTKGDLIVHDGTNSIRIAVGSNDQVLTADSAQASGVKWAAAGGSGAPTGAQYVVLATDGTLTAERVLTAGKYMAQTDGGANAAITYDFAPHRDYIFFVDEFISSDGSFISGELNWSKDNISGGSLAFADNVANHPGLLRMITGTTSGGRASISLTSSGNGKIIQANEVDNIQWIVKAQSGTTSIEVQLGVADWAGGAPTYTGEAQDGIYFSFVSATNANWRTITRSGGTATATNSSVAYTSGNYYQLEARRSGSNIEFLINNTVVATHTTNIPTTLQCNIWAAIKTTNTTTKEIYVDRFQMRSTQFGQRWT